MPQFQVLQILLDKYFPGEIAKSQFSTFQIAFQSVLEWNEKLNLISRKDLENLAERHFLHSLAIAKVIQFEPEMRVMDVGTGGGFPGIPLAILFPKTHFLLVDSIAKKEKAVADIVHRAALQNVQTAATRAELIPGKFDFIISRAVAPLPVFIPWVRNKIKCDSNRRFTGGIFYLKGESWKDEILGTEPWAKKIEAWPLSDWFDEPFFSTKYLLYIPLCY